VPVYGAVAEAYEIAHIAVAYVPERDALFPLRGVEQRVAVGAPYVSGNLLFLRAVVQKDGDDAYLLRREPELGKLHAVIADEADAAALCKADAPKEIRNSVYAVIQFRIAQAVRNVSHCHAVGICARGSCKKAAYTVHIVRSSLPASFRTFRLSQAFRLSREGLR